MPVLIWPLLDKLRRPTAYQRRPTAFGNRSVTLQPTAPMDALNAPGRFGYGVVESDPQLWNIAPWQFGLCAIRAQAIRLADFKTNPRASAVSEQKHEPAPIHPLILGQVLPPAPPAKDDRQTSTIIFPLLRRLLFNPNRITAGSPINLQVRVSRISAQQNPKATPATTPPATKPWAFPKASTEPAVVHATKPLPARTATIEGYTRDSAGAILANCVVELYLTATDEALMKTTSDANGFFRFTCARYSPATHYLIAYKAGGTDLAGTTLNTLTGFG